MNSFGDVLAESDDDAGTPAIGGMQLIAPGRPGSPVHGGQTTASPCSSPAAIRMLTSARNGNVPPPLNLSGLSHHTGDGSTTQSYGGLSLSSPSPHQLLGAHDSSPQASSGSASQHSDYKSTPWHSSPCDSPKPYYSARSPATRPQSGLRRPGSAMLNMVSSNSNRSPSSRNSSSRELPGMSKLAIFDTNGADGAPAEKAGSPLSGGGTRDDGASRFKDIIVGNPNGITCCDLPNFITEAAVGGYSGTGVLVERMAERCEALSQGLMVGDVIARVNRQVLRGHRSTVDLINTCYKNGFDTVLTVANSRRVAQIDKRHGRVGISCTNLLRSGEGVLVCRVEKDGLAYKAGMRIGTMLLSVNGALCETHQEAVERIDQISPVVSIVYRANAEEITLKQDAGQWGLTVSDSELCVGVLVASVITGSAAERAGLQPQDLLLGVCGVLVRSAAKAMELLQAPGPMIQVTRRV